MTASTSPEDAFYIVPYSSLIPSHEAKDPVKQPETINPTIARLIKAVQDNPTKR